MQTSGNHAARKRSYVWKWQRKHHTLAVMPREGGASSIPETPVLESRSRGVLDTPHARGMTAFLFCRRADALAKAASQNRDDNYTGSAIEYFTWLSAKLDSIEAMPSSRVSLFFRNAS